MSEGHAGPPVRRAWLPARRQPGLSPLPRSRSHGGGGGAWRASRSPPVPQDQGSCWGPAVRRQSLGIWLCMHCPLCPRGRSRKLTSPSGSGQHGVERRRRHLAGAEKQGAAHCPRSAPPVQRRPPPPSPSHRSNRARRRRSRSHCFTVQQELRGSSDFYGPSKEDNQEENELLISQPFSKKRKPELPMRGRTA